MEHDRAIGRTAHAGVGNAHHILDAGLGEFGWDRQIARLWHRGFAGRAGILQHQKVVRRHVKIRIVDARGEIFERIEHDGAAFAFE